MDRFSFDDNPLNLARIHAFCRRLDDCRTPREYDLASQMAHWFLCAFWHGCPDQYQAAQQQISAALDRAERRL